MICETCGGNTHVILEDEEPVSACCGDYIMIDSRRYTTEDHSEDQVANRADARNALEREGGLDR